MFVIITRHEFMSNGLLLLCNICREREVDGVRGGGLRRMEKIEVKFEVVQSGKWN
jgi:hypothetical protein